MSIKNIPLSTKDKFGVVSERPTGSSIDWKMVAIYGGIAVISVTAFALIISSSQEHLQSQWKLSMQESNQKFANLIQDQASQLNILHRELQVTKDFYNHQKIMSYAEKNGENSRSTEEGLGQ